MIDYRESQMRSYAQHRTAHGDAKASHETPKPTAREELEADLDRDRHATGPDRAQEQRGRDLERP